MNQVHYVERKKGRLQHLKERVYGFYRRFWVLLLALVVVGVTAPQTMPFSGKCAEAHTLTPQGTDLQVGEYCYRMKVTVTNADNVSYNDQPAPFTVNAESVKTAVAVAKSGASKYIFTVLAIIYFNIHNTHHLLMCLNNTTLLIQVFYNPIYNTNMLHFRLKLLFLHYK